MRDGPHARLRVPAELDRLAELRGVVRDAARAWNAPPTCVDDLVQAVDEAATNIVVHGYGAAQGAIDMDVRLVDGNVVIELEDTAAAFDPTDVPEPDLTVPPMRRRPGGMGLHLIRLATDSLTYRPRPGGGNILTLTRSLDPRAKEER